MNQKLIKKKSNFKSILLLVLTTMALPIWSKPIDENTARKVAAQTLSHSSALRSTISVEEQGKTLKLLYKNSNSSKNDNTTMRATQTNTDETVYFYVFGTENNEGFVIVSGDDRVTPVLGYSHTNSFSAENMPDNMVWWLDEYTRQIEYAIENDIEPTTETEQQWVQVLEKGKFATSTTTSVSPLLTTTWNQWPYYNQLCPDNTPTGCVATAMAQIMKYHNHPVQGTGSHSYDNSTYGTLSADFGATAYQWENMPNSLSAYSSKGQITAIATLMYHCGVAVNMNYQLGGSGASIEDVPNALLTYFGYENSMILQTRNNSDVDWDAMLRSELDASRPIYYRGSGTTGHAFVCDGYNMEGFFHFNWGWSGMDDGWFQTSALNTSYYTFNDDQAVILHITPRNDTWHIGYPNPEDITANFNNGTLTISGTGTMQNFDSTPWHNVGDEIFSVVIKDKVTTIGDNAFANCAGITSIEIPNSVVSIGRYALASCYHLTSITIPNSTTSIGDFAFIGCHGLTSVTIPKTVKSIGVAAFSSCFKLSAINVEEDNMNYSSLEGVFYNKDKTTLYTYPIAKSGAFTIPNSVIVIGTIAFGDCNNLTSITIPNSVTTIENYAFGNCSNLTSVTIPSSVITIGEGVFGGCTGLVSIAIPRSVTSIGSLAFFNCTSLKNVTVGWETPLSVPSDIFRNVNTSTLTLHVPANTKVLYQADPVWGTFGTIDDGTSSGDQTWNLSSTMTATLDGKGVLTITTTKSEGEAMPNYRNMGDAPWYNVRDEIFSVVIKDKVTTIGDYTFFYCTGITSIAIPNSVVSIGENALSYCGLTSITIPNSITNIGGGAFSGCFLTSITIPKSVKSIGEAPFISCLTLSAINVEEDNMNYSSLEGVFYNKDKTVLYTYPEAKSGAFTIPNSVIIIGAHAFNTCDYLTSITIPNSVTTIENSAFLGCTRLTSVTIPSSIITMGNYVFYDCQGLVSIAIPRSVTSIGSLAFLNCTNLKNITVEWETPLSVPSDIFRLVNTTTITLHVPANTKALYQADPVWGTFGTIDDGTGGSTPPTCAITEATNITAHSATLNGQVNPNGLNTSYLFQYSTNVAFPSNSTQSTTGVIIGSGTDNISVSATVTNLSENTHYYYRIAALNSSGGTTSSYSTFDTPFDIQLNASMGIPASMSTGQSYNVSIKVLNNSLEQFRGCFYLKDGNTNELDWSNVTINSNEIYTLEKSYTPTSSGTKTLTLYHQANCNGSGVPVDAKNYSNPITVTISSPTYYTVTFDANGGSPTPASQSVVSGGKATEPTKPTRSGYTFDGWYDGSTLWDFNNPVNKNMTLTAKWTANTPDPYINVSPSGDGANPVPLAGDNGATKQFTVESNIDWTVAITNSATSWLSVTKNSNTSFTVKSLNANDTGNPRGAVVTVSGPGASQTIYIRQNVVVTATFNISPTGTKSVDSKSGYDVIQVTSNINWNASVSSVGNWLGINKKSGSGNDVITYTYDANTGSARTGTISVTANNTTYTLVINQIAATVEPYLILPNKETNVNSTSGTGSFKVYSNTSWTANVYYNWVTVKTSSGKNDGSIEFSYFENPTSTERSAIILVEGGGYSTAYTITQSGSSVSQTYKLNQRFPQNNASDMPRSTPKFDWEDSWVANPKYELQIMGTLKGTVIKTVNNSSEYQFDSSEGSTLFEYNKTYSWKVKEVSTTSPTCEWSETRYYTVSPNYSNGPILGHFNDAIIRKNDGSYDPQCLLQCVEYVQRYHKVVSGLSMTDFGNACDYYDETQKLGFDQFPNGSSFTPEVGDIICFRLGRNSAGHVGIIREVGSDYVNIAQQNMISVEDHISKHVGLSISNGKYTINDYLTGTYKYQLQGWRRAQPTVISPKVQNQVYNTTDVLIKWHPFPASISRKYHIKISTYNPQTKMYEGLAADEDVSIDSYTFKGQANKQYRCRVYVYTCNGTVVTEPIYFSIGNIMKSTTDDENITRLHIKTLKQTDKGVVVASNIRIEEMYEGYILSKGETNEEGVLNVEIAPALKAGDILLVSGTGVISKDLEITNAMLASGEAQVILQENTADNSIIDPRVEILNFQPVYKDREVKLKITAKNHSAFQIIDYKNSSDTLTASTQYEPADSLVSFILNDVGENALTVRFLGENEVWISKTLIFNPEIANLEMASVTLLADNNSLGSKIYLNGSFLKEVTQAKEVLQVPLGFQNFTFVKENYATVFATTQGDETIDLKMTYSGIKPVNTEEMRIAVYPNPVDNTLTVKFPNPDREKATISVLSLTGQIVYQAVTNETINHINVQSLEKGVYILYVKTKKGNFMEKLIKK